MLEGAMGFQLGPGQRMGLVNITGDTVGTTENVLDMAGTSTGTWHESQTMLQRISWVLHVVEMRVTWEVVKVHRSQFLVSLRVAHCLCVHVLVHPVVPSSFTSHLLNGLPSPQPYPKCLNISGDGFQTQICVALVRTGDGFQTQICVALVKTGWLQNTSAQDIIDLENSGHEESSVKESDIRNIIESNQDRKNVWLRKSLNVKK
ncbi:hypothetical protein HGM15179_002389 [Zosterops borbonicus]|uniref:Uncharacterized protein n=1 Tax=Zosterops borbonicus TaxID=364589 RepID=A0A8K1GTU6_9PASS|nr:hypothetical protein HGM15179_002389 [Zosterops borbonicus]